jgi:hypothetical protein
MPDPLTLILGNPAAMASFVTVSCNFELLFVMTFITGEDPESLVTWGGFSLRLALCETTRQAITSFPSLLRDGVSCEPWLMAVVRKVTVLYKEYL